MSTNQSSGILVPDAEALQILYNLFTPFLKLYGTTYLYERQLYPLLIQ